MNEVVPLRTEDGARDPIHTPADLASRDFADLATTNVSGAFMLFEWSITIRVAATSAGDTSPKFSAEGSTRKAGRITPEMLTK